VFTRNGLLLIVLLALDAPTETNHVIRDIAVGFGFGSVRFPFPSVHGWVVAHCRTGG
jgi:hypothetical protein